MDSYIVLCTNKKLCRKDIKLQIIIPNPLSQMKTYTKNNLLTNTDPLDTMGISNLEASVDTIPIDELANESPSK